jgi:hypothetical protein
MRPVERSVDLAMPKSSTFYGGQAGRRAKHLFLHFQHSSKPWSRGSFTVNVILSAALGPPSRWYHPAPSEAFLSGSDGSYRLGQLLYKRDKWWCLAPTDALHGLTWKPSCFVDQGVVFQEAIVDVSQDVEALLRQLHHGE